MKVNIRVFEGGAESKRFLYNEDIELKKGSKKTVEIPFNSAENFTRVLISSDTFVPAEVDSNSKDSRKSWRSCL